MEEIELSEENIKLLNDFDKTISFVFTSMFIKFVNLPHKIIALFTGNQWGKTTQIVMSYVLRILSIHPIPDKNVNYLKCKSRYCGKGHRYLHGANIPTDNKCTICGDHIGFYSAHKFLMLSGLNGKPCPTCGEEVGIHRRKNKIIRFMAEVKPSNNKSSGGSSSEVKNTIYPKLKEWLPSSLIVDDITSRDDCMEVTDIFGGNNILLEFCSYEQTVQRGAGVQRMSVMIDEECPEAVYSEQAPRLFDEDGDIVIGCTPALQMTHYYDNIFTRARTIIRSKTITEKFNLPTRTDYENVNFDIAVMQAATDDNPTIDNKTMNAMFENIADSDTDAILIRRYGMFKQAKGRVYKNFSYSSHVIEREKYFSSGLPTNWVHGRFIDYHINNDWACLIMSLSPDDEAFIWGEYSPSPGIVTVKDMMKNFCLMSKGYKMTVSLVDALSETVKKDNISVKDDINNYASELYKDGTVNEYCNFQSWDTKGDRGRLEIILRLENALKCKKPFNNKVIENGAIKKLPTLWILDRCPLTAKSLNSCKYKENKRSNNKDKSDKIAQEWSHFPMCVEAAFKSNSFKARNPDSFKRANDNAPKYFRVNRR